MTGWSCCIKLRYSTARTVNFSYIKSQRMPWKWDDACESRDLASGSSWCACLRFVWWPSTERLHLYLLSSNRRGEFQCISSYTGLLNSHSPRLWRFAIQNILRLGASATSLYAQVLRRQQLKKADHYSYTLKYVSYSCTEHLNRPLDMLQDYNPVHIWPIKRQSST